MATVATIEGYVTNRIIDLPSTVTAEVARFVRTAYMELQKRHNFKVMEGVVTYTTVAATRNLNATLPTNFKEFRDSPWLVPDTGKGKEMIVLKDRFVAETTWDVEAEGEPAAILRAEPTDQGAAAIEVWPLSDSLSDYVGGEYRVKIPYWKYIPIPTGGNENWFTLDDDIIDFIAARATAMGFAMNWEADNARLWNDYANAKIMEIIATDKKEMVAAITTMVPQRRWTSVR